MSDAEFTSAQSLILEGEQQKRDGDFEAAIVTFSRVLELPLEASPERNTLRAYALSLRGVAYTKTDKLTQAIDDLTSAIQIAPERPLAYLHRAEVWEQLGEEDQALDDYAKAIKLDPEIKSLKQRRF